MGLTEKIILVKTNRSANELASKTCPNKRANASHWWTDVVMAAIGTDSTDSPFSGSLFKVHFRCVRCLMSNVYHILQKQSLICMENKLNNRQKYLYFRVYSLRSRQSITAWFDVQIDISTDREWKLPARDLTCLLALRGRSELFF